MKKENKKTKWLNRQNIRSMTIFISFLLFPIIQWYFSPFLIIMGALEGIINGSFIVFMVMIVIGFFFGRGACGFIMPCAGLQECMFSVNGRQQKNRKLFKVKYVIWAIWVLVIAAFAWMAKGYHQVDFFYAIPSGISIDAAWKYIIYYIVVVTFFLMSLFFGKRASCHYICWVAPFMVIGRKLRNLLGTPALQLTADESKCIDCKICERECPMSLPVSEMVQEHRMEQSECILCGKCADSCPKKVIHLGFGCPERRGK